MKKLLKYTLLPFLIAAVLFIRSNDFSPPPSTNDCLVGKDWCHPDCSNAIEHWKFQSDSTFIYSGNRGAYAFGTWKDIGNNQIEIIYTQTLTEDELSKEILSMPDCSSLKVGDNVFSSY